jgi:SAM-dependent methyltransferase
MTQPIEPTEDTVTQPAAVWQRYGAPRQRALEAAPSIYAYRQPPLDAGFAARRLPLAGATVLDAGCGSGQYLPHLVEHAGPEGRVIAFDFTPEMLRQSRQHEVAGLVHGDVQRLPFADARFDVVLSAHMLYHVPDIRAALREFRRVLRADGTLAIIVGSERDQGALDDLFLTAGGVFPMLRYWQRFTADNAPDYLDGIFARIERDAVTPEFVVPDPEVLVAYFEGERTLAEPALRADVTWDAFLENVRRIAAETIAREGAFRVPEEIVMLKCTL